MNILVLHGPNLNLLGKREPAIYGNKTLAEVNQTLEQLGSELGCEINTFQSNSEHQLINAIHYTTANMIIINPAAFTHTSVAIRDALLARAIPFIEVHISNVYQRESFRHHSYFSDIAKGTITGFGIYGYELAVHAAMQLRQQQAEVI